jgi:hypothetical protein
VVDDSNREHLDNALFAEATLVVSYSPYKLLGRLTRVSSLQARRKNVAAQRSLTTTATGSFAGVRKAWPPGRKRTSMVR